METRKIQQVGGGTYTVSVPREWADSEGVSQGDGVNLHAHLDGVLVVEACDRDEDPIGSVSVSVDAVAPEHAARLLQAAYAAGYDEVTLTASGGLTEDQRDAVTSTARTLAGATVSTNSPGAITVHVLLDSDEISIRQTIRQLSFTALSACRDAVAVAIGDTDPSGFAASERQTGRLYAIAERSFSRALARLDEMDALGYPRPALFELTSTAHHLNRVTECADRIAAAGRNSEDALDTQYTSEVEALAEQALSVVDRAVDGVLSDEGIEEACRAIATYQAVREEATAMDRRLFADSNATYRLARVLDGVREVADQGERIANRGLQSAFQQGDVGGDTGFRPECRRREDDVPAVDADR